MLVAVWYGASVVAIASAKTVLLIAPAPATLCAVQFAIAALGAWQLQGASHAQQPQALSSMPEFRLILGIATTYACGFLLTNAAIGVAAPSLVETFKAAEPISTVALAVLFLGEREKLTTYLSLFPIMTGVAIASSSRATFSAAGMALSLASNVSFSGHAVLTKALKRRFPGSRASTSDAYLFYHVSRLGVLMLLPFVILLDAGTIASVLRPARPNATPRDASSPSGSADGSGGTAHLLLWLLINACAHASYNGVSFVVLGRVSVATHAVLNIVRRIVCIAAAAIFFGTPVSAWNWLGVGLAGAGVAAFARSKERGAAEGRSLPRYMVSGKARAV